MLVHENVLEEQIIISGETLEVAKRVIQLGHLLNDNIFIVDTSKCVGDFNKQCSLLLSDFKYASSFM